VIVFVIIFISYVFFHHADIVIMDPTCYNLKYNHQEDRFAMNKWGKIRENKRIGRWYIDITWKGTRHHIYKIPTYAGFITCTSYENAIELRSIINSEIERNIFNPARYKEAKPLHLESYALEWLNRAKHGISKTTLHDYNNSIKNHILPYLGNKYLPDINADTLKDFYNQIQRETKGKKNVMGCLHNIMSAAYDAGHISKIPKFPKITLPKKVILWIDKKDQNLILDKIPLQDRYIYQFMMLTGCRPSEARALRKIDITKSDILFRISFDRYEQEVPIKTNIERKYPLIDILRDVLKENPDNLTPYVFVFSKTGKPYTRTTINRIWNRANKEANLPKINLYNATKHSLGCQLIDAGVDKDLVKQLFGHTSTKTTDRYAEASQITLRNALDKVVSFEQYKSQKLS